MVSGCGRMNMSWIDAAVVLGQCGKHIRAIAIDDGILVAHGQREGQPDADIAARLSAIAIDFIQDRHLAARSGVMNHHRRRSLLAPNAASETAAAR